MEKESLFNFSDEQLRQIGKISKEPERRVIIGFNENITGEAVVTTGIPTMYQQGKVSYVKKRTLSYENYMLDKIRNSRRYK